jgi:hypothetical protein
MMLDVFKTDAFHYTKLVAAINRLPHVPTKLGKKGIFREIGVPTLTVAIEMKAGTLTLVPAAGRGTRGPVKNPGRRSIVDVRTTHLPQSVAIMADEVIGLRSFGAEQDTATAMNVLMEKVQVARTDLDITHEFHRMGALKGQVLDSDGTTVLYDFNTLFGTTKTTFDFALDNDATDVREKCTQYKRAIEAKLGGVMMTGLDVECSAEFFDALTAHPEVKESYTHQSGQVNRADLRDGFEFGGIFWSEYRGSIGAQRFIAAGRCVPIPRGVSDLFMSYYSPAPYMEAVGTNGLPFYMKGEDMRMGVGIEYDIQSNPLHIVTRPEAIIEGGKNAAALA